VSFVVYSLQFSFKHNFGCTALERSIEGKEAPLHQSSDGSSLG
jgi:hypothetical protein